MLYLQSERSSLAPYVGRYIAAFTFLNVGEMARKLRCEICGSTFTCNMGESGCWCSDVVVSEESLLALRKVAKDCVCPNCLAEFSTSNKI
jgi:hypothetical protein